MISVFSYEILPKYAILDPELIMTAPASITASCGVDALIHAMEAYISNNASPFSDAMAEKAMELIGKNLRRFVANRRDEEAACAMMAGCNFAGISFAWARLGNVHAMRKEEVIPAMAEDAMKSGNIPANPRQTNVKDIIALYHKAMNMD